jgi:hypothetical protein
LKDEEVHDTFETLEDARTCLNQSVDGLFRVFYLCDGNFLLPYGQA